MWVVRCLTQVVALEALKEDVMLDVDQSTQSDTVITSAMKGLAESVIEALTKYCDGGEAYGGFMKLGAADNAVGIPTDTWQLENWSVDDYKALYEKVVAGEIKIDNDDTMKDPSKAGLENIRKIMAAHAGLKTIRGIMSPFSQKNNQQLGIVDKISFDSEMFRGHIGKESKEDKERHV